MRFRKDATVVLAAVLCALVFFGEFTTYYDPLYDYDVEVEWQDGSVEFTVSSDGSNPYDAVLLSGGRHISELHVFVDDTYDTYFLEASKHSRFTYIEQDYYYEQVSAFMGVRSFDDVYRCDPSGLASLLESTMGDEGVAVAITSYALPASVYDGTTDCILLRWISAGGNLYWISSEVGRFYTDGDGLHVVEDNQALFFGTECINTMGPTIATSRIYNGFDTLTLNSSNVMNGIDVSGIPGALGIGYIEAGYVSIGLVPFGSGELIVIAGKFDINQLDDFGQIVVSGISSASNVLNHNQGTVRGGSIEGSFEIPEEVSDLAVYIYIGGTYVRYGEASHGP